ncbi:MAG TPA: 16S rRNA (cytidine(1402)-2'-O)-methyltransferase [bacterium]|nr:16S rRNA (cytidine(1402)-2'-O)-methyltransferase [bacterium]
MKPLLTIVPTPIGNLDDITLRALQALRTCDRIAAEDTRHTAKLLARHGIDKPLMACEAHGEEGAAAQIVRRLQAGETIALVTDGGMPGISDPGYRVVAQVIAAKLPFTVLPGPSAIEPALLLSGLPSDRFTFLGFLPRKGKERAAALARLAAADETCVIYESPERIVATVAELARLFPGRAAAVVREISKLHEEAVRFTLGEAVPLRAQGECVLLVGPRLVAPPVADDRPLAEQVAEYERLGFNRRDALKAVAAARGMKKSELYRELHGDADHDGSGD